ncbi:NAD(P)-dependent oxidoreductase (plasmid) [Lactiplantibacillus plantarum]|uniref:NAD-dependent epimerase/dehydratase family protein n=1 Tax=Lactiplantibacillus plantarum TaxID=1590 RepID=UPI00338FCED6
MRILVTGANGYLGRGITKELLNYGHEVIATGYSLDGIDDRAKKIECDLFSVKEPYIFFGKPEVVLHLAWKDGFVHNSDKHIDDLPKHFHFLKSMSQSGVKKISVMGSMHEVGFFEGSVDEDTPCHPMSMYGIGKNTLRSITELIAKDENIEFQWLRGFYIVGNSPRGNSIFSKIIDASIENKKTFPFTMGQNQYDFLNYDVFCKYVAAAVGQDDVNGIINICSGHPEKLADRVETFIKENKLDIKLEYGKFPDRPYDSKAIWGNNKKITKIINEKKYLKIKDIIK